jgi:hypothetical protein
MTEFTRNFALFDMDFVAEFDRLAEFGCLIGFGRQPNQ